LKHLVSIAAHANPCNKIQSGCKLVQAYDMFRSVTNGKLMQMFYFILSHQLFAL